MSVFVDADLARTVTAFSARYQVLMRLESDWREQAACASRSVPPVRWFFPDSTHLVPGSKKIRRARRTCAMCPVRRPCLQVAIAEGLEGVWAGTTDADRERVEHLPLEQQVEILEEQFIIEATTGPWRVVSHDELVEAGERADSA
jgi:WhiB family redox-sensing transcriptional regulator